MIVDIEPTTTPTGATQHPLRNMAVRDAKGEATEEEAAYLRANPYDWLDTLKELNGDLHAQFMEKAAHAQEYKNRCHQDKVWGKDDWFTYKEDYDRWRAKAGRFRQMLDAKKLEAKRHIRAHALPEVVAFLSGDKNIAPEAREERDRLVGRLLAGTEPDNDPQDNAAWLTYTY